MFAKHTAFEEPGYKEPAYDVALYYVDSIVKLISHQIAEYDLLTKVVGTSLKGLFTYIIETITSLEDEKSRDSLVIEYAGLLLTLSCYHLEGLWDWNALEPYVAKLNASQKREVIEIVKAYIPAFYTEDWEFELLHEIVSDARFLLKNSE